MLQAQWLEARYPDHEQWVFADCLIDRFYERRVQSLLEELQVKDKQELETALNRRGTSLERLRAYHRLHAYVTTANDMLNGRRIEIHGRGSWAPTFLELKAKTKIEMMFDDPARANEEEKEEKDVDAAQAAAPVASPAPDDETPDELPSIEIEFDQQKSLYAGDKPGESALKRGVAFAYGAGDRKAIAGVEAIGGRVDPLVSTNSSVVDRDGVKKVRVVVSGIRFNVTLGDAKKEQGGGGLTAEAVEALQEFDHSVRLFLEGKLTTDADLARVRELPGVFGISVGKSQTTDAGFAELARAKQLSEVQWFGACADAGPAALAKLPDLRMLHVWGGTLTAEGVRTISGFPKLTNLYLMGEPVTSKGFEAVLSMQRLEMLGLTAKLTDKELEQLSKLKALKRLAYFGTKEEGGHLGEPEIRVLAGLKQLRTLSVGMCRVRREFIEELRTANHLQSADLQQCRFVDVVGKPGTANIVRLLPVLKPVPVPAASPIAAETRREGKLDVSIEPMPVIPAGFEAEEKGSRKDETKVPAKEEGGSADALNGPLELKALASKLRDEGAPIVVVPDQHNTILDLREPGESVLTSRVPFAFTEDERAAIRVIEAAGGKVRVLSGVGRMAIETKAGGKLRPTVTDLRFSAMFRESSMTPDAYAAVLGMKRMVRLSMFGSSLSDRQLQRLSELDQLRTFQYLPHANGAAEGVESVDEETLRILAGLKQLRELTVNNCRVTRSVIEELRGATHLRELSLLCRIVKPYGAVTGEKLVRLLAPAVQPAASETSGGRPAAPKLSLSIRDSPKVRPGFRPLRSGAEPDTIEVDPDYDDTTIRRHQRR